MKLKTLIISTLLLFSFTDGAWAFNPKAIDNFNKGYIYYGERKFEKAALEFKKVLIFESNNDKVYEILGNIFRQLNNLNEAKYYSNQAIRINPENDNAYANLGNILVVQNKLNDALFYFKKAVEINPSNTIASSQIESINKINTGNQLLLIKK